MLKYLALSAVLAGIALSSFGCCGICNGDGVAYTRRERQARHRDIIDNDCRQFVDDCDSFWLMDHKTHLSQWQVE